MNRRRAGETQQPVRDAGREELRTKWHGKGIIPGVSSFEVIPGHLIPSKQPECGRLRQGRDPGEHSLEPMLSRGATEHEAWGWGPAPLIEERALR